MLTFDNPIIWKRGARRQTSKEAAGAGENMELIHFHIQCSLFGPNGRSQEDLVLVLSAKKHFLGPSFQLLRFQFLRTCVSVAHGPVSRLPARWQIHLNAEIYLLRS